jgi:hypothetical protein
VEVALFAEGNDVVARRDGAELRIATGDDAHALAGDARVLDHADAVARAVAAVRCPNAGEVVVSATPGWEFEDLGGRHHLGGGSHGSLVDGDSIVPVLTVGLGEREPPRGIVDVAPAILAHFGARVPDYALGRAA